MSKKTYQNLQLSAMLPCSPQLAYRIINQISCYPEFLPWCVAGKVHQNSRQSMTGSLELNYQGIAYTFCTKNSLTPHQSITMQLESGPFDHLEGTWKLSPQHTGCQIDLQLQYALRHAPLGGLINTLVEKVSQKVLDCFCQRIAQTAQAWVEVAYVARDQQQALIVLPFQTGLTAQEAIQQSHLLEQFPELHIEELSLGIFSRPAQLATALKAGDRIEIYRPLTIDPKTARHHRVLLKESKP